MRCGGGRLEVSLQVMGVPCASRVSDLACPFGCAGLGDRSGWIWNPGM